MLWGDTLQPGKRGKAEMTKNMLGVLYAVVMIAVVVGVDLLFFRHRFLERLLVNIGIIAMFAAFYLRVIRSP